MNDDRSRAAPAACDTCGREVVVAPPLAPAPIAIRCADCERMREFNPERWDKLFMQTNGNYP